MSNKDHIQVALIGNPNSGKSSVFNRFTGLNQTVGNFPGVTVDKKTGVIQLSDGRKATLIDLPGTYSLYPNSMDEKIVLDILTNPGDPNYPDSIIYVIDASHLERHLLLLTQIIDLGIPCVLALNMIDIAGSEGKVVDIDKLSHFLGIPVVPVNGRTGEGIDQLKEVIPALDQNEKAFLPVPEVLDKGVKRIKDIVDTDSDYRALLIAHHHQQMEFLELEKKEKIAALPEVQDFKSISEQVDEIMRRFHKIKPLCSSVIQKEKKEGKPNWTQKLDSILTHKLWGSLIFLGILFLMFQAIFAWANYPMDLIDEGMSSLIAWLNDVLPASFLTSLLTDGILAGLGGVIIFIPQITILFALIAILEEIGYMSRAVYLSDSIMRRFGLNGRSIVALISGVACAIPAVMSTRTISNWKERLITIFVTPLISCSARIPVFTVLIALVVPEETVWGFWNLQGLVMLAMYILGASAALFSAYIFKKILKTREASFLMMEMPVYQSPYWKNVFLTVFEKVKIFVFEAGKVILVISIILWALASYGPQEKMAAVEVEVEQGVASGRYEEAEAADLLAAKKIEVSYAGHFGKFIEPVIKPLGFDWKMGIALITSFAAREVFVGTMATIYSIGSSDDELTITERMRREKNPVTGEPIYNKATGFSLMIFYVFAMQCMSTLAVVKRETKSWLIPMYQLLYMTGLAYLGAWVTFTLLS